MNATVLTRFRVEELTLKQLLMKSERSPSPLQKRTEKSTARVSEWMRATKKDYTFQKVMETQKDFKDTDGYLIG